LEKDFQDLDQVLDERMLKFKDEGEDLDF